MQQVVKRADAGLLGDDDLLSQRFERFDHSLSHQVMLAPIFLAAQQLGGAGVALARPRAR